MERELSRKTLKTIEISEVELVLSEGTTDEKNITSFWVKMDTPEDHIVEPFVTREEAEAYAADIATRPLRPFDFARMLEPR